MVPLASTTVDLARIQFATTSIYHFLFVPLTLGLAPLVAIMQTIWYRTRDEDWLRLTRFFGTLLLINFAIGVATGLVQEFQFGMSWSVYSNFVGGRVRRAAGDRGSGRVHARGDVPGAVDLRLGAAAAAGAPRDDLDRGAGTWLSAYLILVANSWMQHPVGYKMVDGKAQLTSVGALLSNSFALIAWLHTILAGSDLRLDRDARHLLLAPAARPERRAVSPGREAGADRRGAGDAHAAVGRQPLRGGGHERSRE